MYNVKPEKSEWYGKRAMLYMRVSTEEQAREGYSLHAQHKELETFAKKYAMEVVGVYADEGISARRDIRKRKGLSDLLNDVKKDKADYILFIKLDRWFRNVQDYYETQAVLDEHNVNWKATLEEYDTSTANGRLNLNIRLSIAQDESDRTSERIRFVNKQRVKDGGVLTGSLPYALYNDNGTVGVDPQKAIVVKDLFDAYENGKSRRRCIDYLVDKHGARFGYNTLVRMLSQPMYMGEYRNNPNYCEPIVSKEQFQKVQDIAERNSVTRSREYEYVFSGLIVCGVCGRNMGAWAQNDYKYGRVYKRYRCNKRYIDKNCSNTQTPWEKRIEDYLLENIPDLVKSETDIRKKQARKSNAIDAAPIKRQLDRLKELYLNELIEIDEYRKDYENLMSRLNAIEEHNANIEKPSTASLEQLLDINIKEHYEELSTSEKSIFWGRIIEKIVPITHKEYDVYFL